MYKVKIFTWRGFDVPHAAIEQWLNATNLEEGFGHEIKVVNMHSVAVPEPCSPHITAPIAQCATIVTIAVERL